MESYDIVVIGSGPGGYPAAIRAAQLGAAVAVIEREELGGTCLNWGCIPTKLLIDSAKLYQSMRRAEAIGIKAENLTLDYSVLGSHKDKTVAKLRGGIGQLLKANGIRVLKGTASFQNSNCINVTSPGTPDIEINAGKFIIATGSTSSLPALFPKHNRILGSREFLALDQLPGKLLVLGGGYIGCELACMAAQLGTRVTVVELQDEVLPGLDPDLRCEVRRSMEGLHGIRILTGKPLDSVHATTEGITGQAGDQKFEADQLLMAIGRRPVTEGLALENAGLKPTDRGFIEVDEFCRTCVPNIYAVGDVNGRAQLAHVATSQGIVAANDACGRRSGQNETVIPGVIFTSPEVGVVGLSELDAKKLCIPVKIGKFGFGALGRSIASGNMGGFAKWIVCNRTDKLLGAAVVGPHATELIAEAAVAIRANLTCGEVGSTIHAHPTFGEIWMEASHAARGEAIHAPPVRKA